MKRLPIKAARDVAKAYSLSQVILAAWDGERTHIVTYGKTTEDCAQAAMGGNKIKDALGWPKYLHAEPSRIKTLLASNSELLAAAEFAILTMGGENIMGGCSTCGTEKQGQHADDCSYVLVREAIRRARRAHA